VGRATNPSGTDLAQSLIKAIKYDGIVFLFRAAALCSNKSPLSWLIRPEDLDLLPRHPDLITIFIIILIPISHMHGCRTTPTHAHQAAIQY